VTLISGSRLEPCEILGPLGEVWRAQDSRLRRDVAIKFLLAADAGRRIGPAWSPHLLRSITLITSCAGGLRCSRGCGRHVVT
jgi:hypothetical protein